jgi:hypothetical protein
VVEAAHKLTRSDDQVRRVVHAARVVSERDTWTIAGSQALDRGALSRQELERRQSRTRSFVALEAERWIPNGEARRTIRALGLGHTSMSVGDILVEQLLDVSAATTRGGSHRRVQGAADMNYPPATYYMCGSIAVITVAAILYSNWKIRRYEQYEEKEWRILEKKEWRALAIRPAHGRYSAPPAIRAAAAFFSSRSTRRHGPWRPM